MFDSREDACWLIGFGRARWLRLIGCVLFGSFLAACGAAPPGTEDPPAPEAARAEPAAATASELPDLDFDRWARFIVRDLFGTQPHEKVLLMADPGYFPELIDALRAEFMEARAVEVGTILFDGERTAERRSAEQPRSTDDRYRAVADAATRRLFEDADIFLWLPGRDDRFGQESGDRRRYEHMVEGADIRGLHMHWIQRIERLSQAQADALSLVYEAALDIDYAALSAHQDRLIEAMRDAEVVITTPAGTELRMHVPAAAWFHKNDGRLDARRATEARSVRDLQMELPAGALRFIPDVDSLEGVLVGDNAAWGDDAGPVRFRFESGRVVAVEADRDDHPFLGFYAEQTGDRDRLAEVVIGTNPALPHSADGLVGFPPYYGYGDGVLRIALGENWESGGANRSSMEAWFYFTDASVTAATVPIVTDGRIVLR